jgi:hypothetical protein
MMTIENLPPIEGGTDKQKMFADSVRLAFISFVETYLPDRVEDAEVALAIRLDYRFWIDNKQIYWTSAKNILAGSKRAVTRAGSIESAIEAQRKTIEKKKDAWKNSRPLGGILDNVRKD